MQYLTDYEPTYSTVYNDTVWYIKEIIVRFL